MFSSITIVVVFILLVVFIFYKRDMLIQMFSIDVTSPANRFQEQLEQTADIVIKRLEEQITHLEYLLEDANQKIISLDNKIQVANKILNNENNNRIECLNQSVNLPATTNIAMVTNDIAAMSINNYKEMGRNDKRSSIIEMADLGYDITEIAKTTGISKGEIMLLLQLNKK